MKILIHDLKEEQLHELFPQLDEDITVIADNYPISQCIGCFGCWIKTPTACVIKDSYQGIGRLISQCEELIIISRCIYGGFSPYVKNVLDRSIAYIHPYFVIRNGEMHHRSRYKDQIELTVLFYGSDITPEERSTAAELVSANGINLNVKSLSVRFCQDPNDLGGIAL